jgi:hypothetical protein
LKGNTLRFTSPYPKFKVTPASLKQSVEWLANGAWREKRAGHTVEFEPQGFTTWEREAAMEYFGDTIRTGRRKTDSTLTTDSPLDWRIGTFDTSTIDDPELRELVEQALLNHDGYGRDYMVFEKPRTPKPWANYDNLKAQGRRTNDMVADEICRLVLEIGVDVGQTMGYESENLNRPEVMAALERLAASDRKPDVIEVGA